MILYDTQDQNKNDALTNVYEDNLGLNYVILNQILCIVEGICLCLYRSLQDISTVIIVGLYWVYLYILSILVFNMVYQCQTY